MLDTGYTGALTLPPSVIARLGLPWHSRKRAMLADGTIQSLEVYSATVIWDGAPLPVLVQKIDAFPLIGMSLMIGYRLQAEVTISGDVRIEALP